MRFLTGVVAALMTFGILTLTLGARHNGHWEDGGFRNHYDHGHHDNCDENGKSQDRGDKDTEKPNEL